MLDVIILDVIMLDVIMLKAVAPKIIDLKAGPWWNREPIQWRNLGVNSLVFCKLDHFSAILNMVYNNETV